MRHIVQTIIIALVGLIAQELAAIDYIISGEQTLYNIDASKTSHVMTVSFTLSQVGTNWSISNTYTNSGVKETIALVGGYSYSASWSLAGTCLYGLAMDRPIDRLDGAPEFPRVLLTAFLTSKYWPVAITNAPAPFLWPRHPALHCYRWDATWSPAAPFLAERIRFQLDSDLVRRVSDDAISSYFRSSYRNRTLFKRFQQSQLAGAQYSVVSWTNWNGASIPLLASLEHTTFSHLTNGGVLRQLLLVSVTSIARPDSDSLFPSLSKMADVQHIADGTNYWYRSPDGKFLSTEEAKTAGLVLSPSPPPPRWLAALLWLRTLPSRHVFSALAIVIAPLAAGALAWLAYCVIASRR